MQTSSGSTYVPIDTVTPWPSWVRGDSWVRRFSGSGKKVTDHYFRKRFALQSALRITTHDVALSEAVEKGHRQNAAKLESYGTKITSYHLVVRALRRYLHDKTGLSDVGIDVILAGAE